MDGWVLEDFTDISTKADGLEDLKPAANRNQRKPKAAKITPGTLAPLPAVGEGDTGVASVPRQQQREGYIAIERPEGGDPSFEASDKLKANGGVCKSSLCTPQI